MRRLAPGLAIPILMGVPVWIETSWTVGFVVAASGALCSVAVLRASLPLATIGGAFALSSLALALREASSSTNMLVVVAFGLALLLLADGVHLCKRFDGAAVTQALGRRYTAWWAGRAAISLAIAMGIAILAPLVAVLLPQVWVPFLAGIGVLAAFATAVAFAWPGMDD